MIEAGCPIERHELRNDEWIKLGIIRAEFEKTAMKDMEMRAAMQNMKMPKSVPKKRR